MSGRSAKALRRRTGHHPKNETLYAVDDSQNRGFMRSIRAKVKKGVTAVISPECTRSKYQRIKKHEKETKHL